MINSRESTGITVAAKRGDLLEIKEILKKRPEAIAETDPSGWNALHAASSNDQKEVIRFLLKRGTPINVSTSTGMTALFLAAFKGCGETVELLIASGANMNQQDDKGDTALHCSYSWGHDAIVALLLGNGANGTIPNNRGKVPLEVARYKKKCIVPVMKGMRVEGNYQGMGTWYPGTVSFVHLNHSYDIDYDDGESEKDVLLACVRSIGGDSLLPPPVAQSRRLGVGDVVEVNYNESGEFYPGVIVRVDAVHRRYDVQYDDGEKGENIRKKLIRFIREGELPAEPTGPVLTVGERVEVRYRGQGIWIPGTIRNVGPNDVYDVTYDNGEWEPVEKENLRLVDQDKRRDLERRARILEEVALREKEKRDRARRKAALKAQQEAEALRAAAYKRAAELAREREIARLAEEQHMRHQRRADKVRLEQLRRAEDLQLVSARNAEDDSLETLYQEEVRRAEVTAKLQAVSAIDEVRAKARKDRIDVLNQIDVTMKEEIQFVKNDRRITPEGYKVINKVADTLLQYPELQIHIEGHTKCLVGICDNGCMNQRLSQARVDNVKDALDRAGCQNAFMTKGWGCKHPEVGAERAVRIFPEDLDYDDAELANQEGQRKANEAARRCADAALQRLQAQFGAKRARLQRQREQEDKLLETQRRAEDDALRAELEAQDIRTLLEKQRQDRIDALNLIEDTMREEIEFVQNDSGITPDGRTVCRKVAHILLQYPELQIHIESHTSCKPGKCVPDCKLSALSQARVDSVRDALIEAGCVNKFMTKGWGCKHPKVGAERVVKIFPEDLEYSMDDEDLRLAEKKAYEATRAVKAAAAKAAEENNLRRQERDDNKIVQMARLAEDTAIANQRHLEDAARVSKFAADVKAAKLKGKFSAVVGEARAKAKQDRIDALNRIEDTMREEIEFVQNDAKLTFDGYAVCTRVAEVLKQYPELQIHVQSHTSCKQGQCKPGCRLMGLSQARVENVRDALIDSGCENVFFTKGWGCKHPEVGAERCVKIFPEDLEWEEEERARKEDERKAEEAIRLAEEEVMLLMQQMNERELRITKQRAEDDARRAEARQAEDDERYSRRVQEFQAAKEKARRDRLAVIDTIEDNMREEIKFIRNEKNLTPEGASVIQRVAKILNEYPELQIHIQGHTFCKKGHCNPDCKLLRLSQGRVDVVKDALVRAGCTNIFFAKGWGCRHPDVGAVRSVKIFPEDIEYDY